MVPVWMILSDLKLRFQGHDITQRQIIQKRYQIELILQRRHFQWPWTTPTPSFKVTPFFDAEYLRNGTTYRQRHWNSNRDSYTTCTLNHLPSYLKCSPLAWTHAWCLPRYWSIASSKIDCSRPHQTSMGRCFNSSTLWICLW